MINSKAHPGDRLAPAKRGGICATSFWARCLAAAGLAILLAVGARADEPATSPATAPAVLNDHDLALLHQLESGSWRERKSAEAELSGRPVDAEPIIRTMLADTKSLEATTRLDRVLQHLEAMRGVGATLITMHMKDAPAKAVYAELFKQAGGALKTQPAKLLDDPNLPALSIDVDHQPFWAVIEKLQTTSNLAILPEPDSVGGCYLGRGGPLAGPHVLSGPFLILLSEAPRLVTGGLPSIALRIYPEPKLHAVLAVDVKVTQAVDDKGHLLEQVPSLSGIFMTDFQSAVGVRFTKPEKNPGTHLVRLVAMVTTQVEFQAAHLDIGNLLKAPPQTNMVGNLAVKFVGCKETAQGYQVSFTTGYDPQMRMVQVFQNKHSKIRVLDAAGHELTPIGSGVAGGGNSGDVIDYVYSLQPAPNRLIYDMPTDIRSIDDPVEFKDLNVPLGGR